MEKIRVSGEGEPTGKRLAFLFQGSKTGICQNPIRRLKFKKRDRLPDGSYILELAGGYALVMNRRNLITGRLEDDMLTDPKTFNDVEAAVADLHQRARACRIIGRMAKKD
jgi:hypothetical protein